MVREKNEKKHKTTSVYRLRAGKIRRILRSDWLPEGAKWANLARSGFFRWFVVVFVYFNVVSKHFAGNFGYKSIGTDYSQLPLRRIPFGTGSKCPS